MSKTGITPKGYCGKNEVNLLLQKINSMKNTNQPKKKNRFVIPWIISILIAIPFYSLAQSDVYPATPTFDQMINDIKKDPEYNIYQSLTALGLDEKYHKLVKFERINTNDKKNFFTEINYYKKNAYKFNDAMSHVVIAVIPKDAFGATYRVPFWISYIRYEEIQGNWTILNKWKYDGFSSAIESMVSPTDLKKVSDADKMKVMESYLKENLISDATIDYNWFFKKVLKIRETGVYNKNAEFGIDDTYGLGKYTWRLMAEYDEEKEKETSGITETEIRYCIFEFDVHFKNGNYEIQGLNRIESNGVTEDMANTSGMTYEYESTTLPEPKRMGNLLTNGWEAVYKQEAPFKMLNCSEEDADAKMNEATAILKNFGFKDDSEKSSFEKFLNSGSNFDAIYEKNKKYITHDLDRQTNVTVVKMEVIETKPKMSEYKESWKALDGWVPERATTYIYLTYKVTYDQYITKKKKETKELTETISFDLYWECINGELKVKEVK